MANSVASENQLVGVDASEIQKQMWAMLAAGLVFGILAMYLMVGRPLQSQMNSLEMGVTTLQRQMTSLTGTNSTAT